MKNSELNKYELMVIIDSLIGESAVQKRLERIKKLISSQKGEVFFEDVWGEKRLGYKMKGKVDGFYVVLNFTLDSDKLKEIDNTLTLESEVIRHLIVKLPFAFEPKSQDDYKREHEAEVEKQKAEKENI